MPQFTRLPVWPGVLCIAEEHTRTSSPEVSLLANMVLIKPNGAGGPAAAGRSRQTEQLEAAAPCLQPNKAS